MIIQGPGHFTRGAFSLDVVDARGSIELTVSSGEIDKRKVSIDLGSAFSRWYLFCEDGGNVIWVYSGDKGTSVINVNAIKSEMSYNRKYIYEDESNLVRKMPKMFYDHLPQSLKRRWSRFRSDVNR